jgi:phosphate transport system permease protein
MSFGAVWKWWKELSFLERVFSIFSIVFIAIAMGSLCLIFGTVLWKFLLNRLNIFSGPENLIYQTVGSAYILMLALPVMIFLAVSLSVWRIIHYWQSGFSEIKKPSSFKDRISKKLISTFDAGLLVLHSVPSIVWGIFGFALFVKGLHLGKSWVAGGLTLGFLGVPFLMDSAIARGKQIPLETISASFSFGISKRNILRHVYLPYICSGIMSGLRVTIPRVLGETAPILLTASVFSGVSFPKGFANEPVLSLPYHIYVLAQDVYSPNAMQSAWNSAFVLVFISLLLRMLVSFVQTNLERKWFPR